VSTAQGQATGSTPDIFVVKALTTSLQIAFEYAVFTDRFEIDEQEPLSRLEALTEQLVEELGSTASDSISDAELASRAAAISIICDVSKRVRGAIR
jgi:hypothetical protein